MPCCCVRFGRRSQERKLSQDNFHAPVLWFTHAVGSRDQGLCFTQSGDVDFLPRNTALDEFFGHRLGAAARQRQIILRRAGTIRMTCNFNPCGLSAGCFGGFTNDLARTRGQISAVPIKKHQKAPHRDGCRDSSGGGSGRIEGIAQAKQEGLVAAFSIRLA